MVADVCTTSSGYLFVIDRNSKQRYLVNPGSDMCVFPRRLQLGRWERTDYTLYAANGTTIPIYGLASRNLKLELHHHFTRCFVIADVGQHNIGVDLLSHCGLLVDCTTTACLTGSHHCPRQASSQHYQSAV